MRKISLALFHPGGRAFPLLGWALFLLCVSGCTSMGHMTAGPDSRQEMLQTELPDFHRAVYWGLMDIVAASVERENRAQVLARLQNQRANEKLVEMQVTRVDFDADSMEAAVEVLTRYYKKPQYIVQERREHETWKYDRVRGWRFSDVTTLTDGISSSSESIRGGL